MGKEIESEKIDKIPSKKTKPKKNLQKLALALKLNMKRRKKLKNE